MNSALLVIAAALSIWEYPARQPRHEQLRGAFMAAIKAKDCEKMELATREGAELLPEDPTWRYNHACAMALSCVDRKAALDELEQAIELGFRDADAIAKDEDFKSVKGDARFGKLVEKAKRLRSKPVKEGPLARVPAKGTYGKRTVVGAKNLGWDFDAGCFVAAVDFATVTNQPYTGDLYYNFDKHHSSLPLKEFPGITPVALDAEGIENGFDVNFPNMVFQNPNGENLPVFGNCSRAFCNNPFWRSIPRAMMTTETRRIKPMQKLYLSNQLWFFPSNADTAPIGTNGDVFASISPCWMTTAGRSWSDQPYLKAALAASQALKPAVRAEILKRGLLAPTVFTLMRKSLKGVKTEDDYLTAKAHPSAMPPGGLDVKRLKAAAKKLTVDEIPPLALIQVGVGQVKDVPKYPEVSHVGVFATGIVLRSQDEVRDYQIAAVGAKEFKFVQTHGPKENVVIEMFKPNVARLKVKKANLSPTNRVDVAVFGRNPGTGWGAPSYVSFSCVDPKAPYSDPALTPGLIPAAPEQVVPAKPGDSGKKAKQSKAK